jgi:hypothetical protein
VEIGSEVNAYLQFNQDEIEPFRVFFSAVYDNIKAEYPDVSVGTVFAYHAFEETDTFFIYERLNIGDHDGFTLYTYGNGFAHTYHPRAVFDRLSEIEVLTGDRHFAMEEVGWTAAPSLSSSESEQRRAVKYFFDYLEQAPDRLEFMNWYALHDMASADCLRIADTFGLPEQYIQLFSDYLCNFGLHKNDGSQRSAWNEWMRRSANLAR